MADEPVVNPVADKPVEKPVAQPSAAPKLSILHVAKDNIERMLSGRLFLTIIAGIILFKMGKFPIEAGVQAKLFDIIEMIVMFYFLKPQDAKPTDEQSKGAKGL